MTAEPPTAEAATAPVEVIFRREWGRAVAVVTRLTGDLGLAEDAVAEAFAIALRRWTALDYPDDPAGWLITVAKNQALDQIRRESRRTGKEAEAMRLLAMRGDPARPEAIADDQLRLIFACCHPALEAGTRVALTLRTLCGLSTAEIASAFLTSEVAMAQRLVRARRKIKDAAIPFRIPPIAELGGRMASVRRVLYLVFTEGHRASRGPDLIRDELCGEAIRLTRLLAGLRPGDPETLGLLALLLLTDARRAARTDAGGDLILLADQDRSRWDRGQIDEGLGLLDDAMRRNRTGPYQLQAAIAACHASAVTAAETDWTQIALLYAALTHWDPSPVVHANRAVAVAMAQGPVAGLAVLGTVSAGNWYLLHACRASLLRHLGRDAEARDAYQTALSLGPPPAESRFLRRQLGLTSVPS